MSSKFLNHKKHPLVGALDRFHVYYHMGRVLRRLQVLQPYESGLNAVNNTYGMRSSIGLISEV